MYFHLSIALNIYCFFDFYFIYCIILVAHLCGFEVNETMGSIYLNTHSKFDILRIFHTLSTIMTAGNH